MKNYIPVSRVEGIASRQAHCDLPEGTYEREMSKEGFFGPAAFFHHRHPPTGWTDFAGPLRPRALDLTQLPPASTSWSTSFSPTPSMSRARRPAKCLSRSLRCAVQA